MFNGKGAFVSKKGPPVLAILTHLSAPKGLGAFWAQKPAGGFAPLESRICRIANGIRFELVRLPMRNRAFCISRERSPSISRWLKRFGFMVGASSEPFLVSAVGDPVSSGWEDLVHPPEVDFGSSLKIRSTLWGKLTYPLFTQVWGWQLFERMKGLKTTGKK